ncbi:complement factor H-like isoform X1 [Scomber scombrus]|uniref:Complement factor H-like isoform X1 n=1 Tax=Scomber scombrus TaxID=13677 RepID=A0AAV1P251_SCOSC
MRVSLILLFLQVWGNVEVSLSQNACSRLPEVPHGYISEETRKDQYGEQNVIHFTCETGYISGPTIRYMCTNTGWIAIHKGKCFLKPCELPDDTPNGYYQITRGEDFVFGTTIKYFCNEGYQMMSKETTRTCYLDSWSNHVPICDPLSCAPPPADEWITMKGLPDNEDPILPDRFLTFSCDAPGKYLNGSSKLICGTDGQWDKPFPTCEDIACKVDELHSHLHVVNLPENKTIKLGNKIRFFCDDQYGLDGPQEIQCSGHEKWSGTFPTCSEKCRITDVQRNTRLERHVVGQQLGKGDKLRFYCPLHGHHLRGNEEVECLANGQWSHPFPTCGEPLGCGRPPFIADSDTITSSKSGYDHEERVQYRCQNYYIMKGGPYKTCFNGEWIGEMRCLKPCTVDSALMNSHNIDFLYIDRNKLYSVHDDSVSFVCKRGTRHDGRVGMRPRCNDGVMQLPTCH